VGAEKACLKTLLIWAEIAYFLRSVAHILQRMLRHSLASFYLLGQKLKTRNNFMSYIKDTLLKDESVLYSTKPHYIIFYTVFMWLFLALFAAKYLGSIFFGGVMLFLAVISFVNDLISYQCSEYAITNKRILMKVGFIRRKSLEIFLDRVEAVFVEQNIFGRILNFGTVVIIGVGGTKSHFFFIANPLKFRSNVQSQRQKSGDK
jgi:hypothetical protein